MPLNAPSKPYTGDGTKFTPAPPGQHRAVLVGIFDVGTHTRKYQDGDKDERRVYLQWELPDELTEDGKPFTVGREFNFSTYESSGLVKFLVPWVGKKTQDQWNAFDFESLLGRAGGLTVSNNPDRVKPDKVWANVDGIAPLMKGMATPEASGNVVCYSIDMGQPPEVVPKFIREHRIAKCHEFAGQPQAPANPKPPTGGQGRQFNGDVDENYA